MFAVVSAEWCDLLEIPIEFGWDLMQKCIELLLKPINARQKFVSNPNLGSIMKSCATILIHDANPKLGPERNLNKVKFIKLCPLWKTSSFFFL